MGPRSMRTCLSHPTRGCLSGTACSSPLSIRSREAMDRKNQRQSHLPGACQPLTASATHPPTHSVTQPCCTTGLAESSERSLYRPRKLPVSGVLPVSRGEGRPQAVVVLADRMALLACSREEGGTELAVEAVEQWDVCRRRSWPERSAPFQQPPVLPVLPGCLNEAPEGSSSWLCREELVFDASESSGEDGEVSQRQPWSAYAETCLPSSSALPLWADSQFHILEMQTGSRQQGSIGTRRVPISLACQQTPIRQRHPVFMQFRGSVTVAHLGQRQLIMFLQRTWKGTRTFDAESQLWALGV